MAGPTRSEHGVGHHRGHGGQDRRGGIEPHRSAVDRPEHSSHDVGLDPSVMLAPVEGVEMPGQDAPPHEPHHGLVPEERHVGQQPHAEENAVGRGESHQHPGHDVCGRFGGAAPVRAGRDLRTGCVAGIRWSGTGPAGCKSAVAVVRARCRWGELRQRDDIRCMRGGGKNGIHTCYNPGSALSSTPLTAWR